MSEQTEPTTDELIEYHRVIAEGGSGHREWSKHTAARLSELQATIDRLPKTADGVPVVPGADFVWRYHDDEQRVVKWATGLDALGTGGRAWPLHTDHATGEWDEDFICRDDGNCLTKQVGMCYSTREAAEQAARAGEGGDE